MATPQELLDKNAQVSNINAEAINANINAKQNAMQNNTTASFNKQALTNPFIVGANANNIAAGDRSMFDSAADATIATGASVLTSFWNTGVALANAFGGDYDEVDTGEFLKSQGLQDSGSYYSEHRQGIDMAGLVAGSLIPGLAGIKALKIAQAGLATSNMRLVAGLGRLANTGDEIKAAIGGIRAGTQKALWSKESASLIARAAGQGALEGTVGSWMMLATMNQAPTLNDTNLGYFESIGKHITTETILGASLGGVLGGGIGALQYRGMARRAFNFVRGTEATELQGIKAPSSVVMTDANGKSIVNLSAGDRMAYHADDWQNTSQRITDLQAQNLAGTITETDKNIVLPTLQQRLLKVNNELMQQIKQVTPDVNLQSYLQKTFAGSPEGIAQVKSTFTGAVNIRPAMDGVGAFRPTSLNMAELAEDMGKVIPDTLPSGFNPVDILYGDNAFMKMAHTQSARFNDLAATGGDNFLTSLIASDAKVFGNSSKTGPINLRRAVVDMESVSRQVNPERWKIADKFEAQYGKLGAQEIQNLSDIEKGKYRAMMDEALRARDLSEVFGDVHNSLFTDGLGQKIVKDYPRLVEYLNTNQLTSKYMKNNFAIMDTQSGKVFHQNILPTPADFGKPALRKTAGGNVVNFGAYSVPLKRGAYSLDDMSKFANASSGGLGTKETSTLLKQLDEYAVKKNAEFVGAQMDSKFITAIEKEDGKTLIGKNDLPYLDAALASKASKVFIEEVGELDKDGLNSYIRNIKSQKIQEVQRANSNFESSWSVEHLSRILNTDDSFVELGALNSTNKIGEHSLSNLAQGDPRYLKIKYATDFDKTQPEIDARWQTITTANKTAATNSAIDVLGQIDTTLAQAISDVTEAMPSAKTIATEQGTSYFGAVNAGFNTYESRMQMIGQLVNTAHHRTAQSIQSTMLPLTQSVLKNDLARAEIGVVIAKARSGKYVSGDGFQDVLTQIAPFMQQVTDPRSLAAFTGKLQNIGTAIREATEKGGQGIFMSTDTMRVLTTLRDAVNNGKTLTPARIEGLFNAAAKRLEGVSNDVFGIKTPEVGEFIKQHMQINSKYVGLRTQLNAANGKITRWNPDELYFGSPDIKGKSIAFIESPATASGERARHMIIANTAEERNAQMAIVEKNYGADGYKVYSDPQMAEYKEALAKWEGGNWNSTPEFSSDLQSKGVANNFFPRNDGRDAVEAVNDTIKRHTQLIRDGVATRYAEDFASLRGMEESWDTMYGKPTKGMKTAYMEDNPARKLRQIGLDMPQDSSKVASYVNSFVENIANKVGTALENAFTSGKKMTMEDVNRINAVMKDAGMKSAYSNAAELMLANSDAPNHLVRQFTATTNAFVSLGMHRLETMMSLINAVGNTVLSVPQVATLIRSLPDDVRFANFGVSNGVGVELSVPKFMAQSMKEIAKDHKNLFARYEGMGLPVTHSRVYSQMMDTLVQEGNLSAGGVGTMLTNKMNQMGDFAGKYNGSNILTGYNRLLYAHMGERLADMAGSTSGIAKSSFINTFMTKVEGTMVSSQRPKFFQGLIGQAMGLFQSYNLHLMQQLTGNILDGNARASIEALAMNATIFGAQSMPGWDELNSVVAKHNRDGFGVDTYLNDALGNDIGEWLTYGSLSNALHMGVFTRGRIELGFGLTGDLVDRIPAASILQNTIAGASQAIGNIAQNGLSTTALLEGLNTMQWNRPVAELAQRALGYTPSKYGDIISYNQKSDSAFLNTWSVFSAALGARDLDASIANSQYYASKQRKAIIQDRLNDLGSKVKKATHNGGELTQEDVENFAGKYAERGGDLKNFQRWVISTSLRGQTAQVEKMRVGISSAAGRQAQALMGGAAPDLFNTTLDEQDE